MRYEEDAKGIPQNRTLKISDPTDLLLFDLLMEIRRIHKSLKEMQEKQNGGKDTGTTGSDQK